MENNQSFEEAQAAFAAELGFEPSTEPAPQPETTIVESEKPVDTNPPSTPPANEVEQEFLSLYNTESAKAEQPKAPEIDEEIMQQHRFRKATGITNYQTFQKVMAADSSVKEPEAQLDLLLTIEEIDGKEGFTQEEREILKARKEKLYGLHEDASDEEKVYGKLQLRKDFNSALNKLSEIQNSVKVSEQAAPQSNDTVRGVILEAVKEPLAINIQDEGVDFKYVPDNKTVAKYYAEIAEAAKNGMTIGGDNPKQTIREYVTMRVMQEHGQDAIKAAIKYGRELQLKETASGRYTPQREVNVATQSGKTPEDNLNSFLGLN